MSEGKASLPKISAGRTATIYKYTGDRVLKHYRSSFPRKAIEEEFAIGSWLDSVLADIPHTYELKDVGDSLGIVFEYIEGKPMLQKLAANPWKLFLYAKQMARLHWKIHSTPITVTNEIPSLKESLLKKVSRASLLNEPEKSTIISHLSLLKEGDSVCHGDFHPDNIIVSNGRHVTIDWLTARIGNPIADVAQTWLLLSMGTLPEKKTAFEVFLARHLRDLFCRSYLDEYKRLSNFDWKELEHWKLPVAAARLFENVSDQENKNLITFIRSKLKM